MTTEYIVPLSNICLFPTQPLTTSLEQVTFDESATTEHINAYMRKIQENGGSVTNRFPDMIARGFS